MNDQELNRLISLHNESDKRLPDKFFYEQKFENCTVAYINDLSGYPVQDSIFTNVVFNEVNFSSAFLYGSKFDSCVFSKCSFVKAEMGEVKIENTIFNGCTFFRTSMNNAIVKNCLIVSSNFEKTIISETKLENCQIRYYGIPIKNELTEQDVVWLEIDKPNQLV